MLGLPFDMASMGACTARHWQTSGRLVQELDVGTVFALCVRIGAIVLCTLVEINGHAVVPVPYNFTCRKG